MCCSTLVVNAVFIVFVDDFCFCCRVCDYGCGCGPAVCLGLIGGGCMLQASVSVAGSEGRCTVEKGGVEGRQGKSAVLPQHRAHSLGDGPNVAMLYILGRSLSLSSLPASA